MDFNLNLNSDEVRREEPVASMELAFASQAKTLDNSSKSDMPAAAARTTLSLAPVAAAQDASNLPLKEPETPAAPPRAPVNHEPLHPWYSGYKSNVPQTLNLRFLDQSPTSSNSSDGSSLFGSPTAVSPGARSTSSGDYDCDSTSSSRDVSPFGSPSGSFPVFRFAIPKDGLTAHGLPATSKLRLGATLTDSGNNL
ncbi:hypothetical protein Gpo141_00011957 [Globisporangium polare]